RHALTYRFGLDVLQAVAKSTVLRVGRSTRYREERRRCGEKSSSVEGDHPWTLSRAGDCHALDSHRRRIGGALELQIIRRGHVQEHVLEIACDRDAAHRPGTLAVLDPEARCTAAVVAGDAVHAETDQLGDVETALDVGDQLVGRELALLQVEVRGRGTGRAGGASRGVAGGCEVELACRGEIEQPCREHAIVDNGISFGRQSFGIERPAAMSALAMRVVEDADAFGENLFAHLVLEERRAAGHGATVDGAGKMADQSAGYAPV